MARSPSNEVSRTIH